MKKTYKTLLLTLSLGLYTISCHSNTEKSVEDAYVDGKPKHVKEYKIKEDGTKTLHKETFYFPEEKKYVEGTYNENLRDGKWTSWFENGKKNSEGTYKNGVLNGKYTVWYPNGQVFYSGMYKEGERVGTWTFYDTLGNVSKTEKF